MTDNSGFWVIAAPTAKTYGDLEKDKIIQIYTKMAFEDFDKQFTKKSDLEKIGNIENIFIKEINEELKKQVIEIQVGKWGEVPSDVELIALIYTQLDGSPKGEANYIQVVNGDQTKIANDLANFYQKYLWKTKTGQIGITPYGVKEEDLNFLLMQKIDFLRKITK